ncbi:MAG: hypothetical protein IKE46_01625 [Selenomonadaceae bacterium]|nr:hypothetical protein [Selenomonadaceae bacterium]
MKDFIFDLQRFPDDEPIDEPEEISYVISSGDVTISTGGAYTIESGFGGSVYVMTGDAVTIDGSGASSLTSAQIYTGTNAADLTLNSVSISNPNVSPLKFGSGGGVLKLVGENVLSTENFYAAAVNVGSGNVTIDGSGTLTATSTGYGAAVGTDYGGTATPNLTVANGTINLSSNYGAGLGSGSASTFGTVSVTGGTVNATSTLGAGIGTGAGTSSENAGSVAITGGKITATSEDGAGIGSGFEGAVGDITIEGTANVNASSTGNGAGIGSGSTGGNESSAGNITIGGNASVVATSARYGAGIGSGYARYNGMNMAGTISIGGDANVTASSLLNGLGIGAGYSDNVALNVVGTISLSGDTDTAAKSAVVIENSDTTRTVTINGTTLSGRQLTFIDGVQSNPITDNNSYTPVIVNESIAGATNVGKVDGSDDYIYLGGIGVISDYAGVTINSASDSVDTESDTEETVTDEVTGAKIRYATDYVGFGFDGYTLAINSSTGALYVQNCKDKILAIADTSGNTTTYVYSPTDPEAIYGNELSHSEIIFGSNNGADIIFAGDGGTTVCGGTDIANDTLVGGAGHDEYIYVDGTGADVVTNYGGEDLIKVSGTINGVNMFGDFALNFADGSLIVANSQDRLITVADTSGNLLGYGYYSSTAGVMDGSNYSGTEVIVGGAFGNNLIIAGDGGSSLWGNFGGVNTLIGGAGHDEFFYTPGSGIVFVQNANAFDTVNLAEVSRSQIAGIAVTNTDTTISFTDGGAINVQGVGLTYKLDGKNYVADSTTQNLVAV